MVDAFCCVNLDAGETFGIFVMSKFEIIFFFPNTYLVKIYVDIAVVYLPI